MGFDAQIASGRSFELDQGNDAGTHSGVPARLMVLTHNAAELAEYFKSAEEAHDARGSDLTRICSGMLQTSDRRKQGVHTRTSAVGSVLEGAVHSEAIIYVMCPQGQSGYVLFRFNGGDGKWAKTREKAHNDINQQSNHR